MDRVSGILIAFVLLVGLLVITKPSFEELHNIFVNEFAVMLIQEDSLEINNEDDLFDIIEKAACQTMTQECAKMALEESGFSLEKKDFVLFRKAEVQILGELKQTCYGYLNTWSCI